MSARLRTTATGLLAIALFLACSGGGGSDSSEISLQTDTDGDGLPDRLELALGSDPRDPNSPTVDGNLDFNTPTGPGPDALPDGLEQYLIGRGSLTPITSLSDRDGDQIPDYLEVRSGSDLTNRDDPVVGGAQDLENLTGPSLDGITDGLESYLLRLGAVPPITVSTDSDRDGLPDVLEVRSGSNPFDALDPPFGRAFDIDLDGLPDWLEILDGSDFLSEDFPTFDGSLDEDAEAGPNGDAIPDGLEGWLVRNGATAPITTLTDSDGDGAPDYVEIQGGGDPFDATNPVANGAGDDDGDGVPNSVEVLFSRKTGRTLGRTSDLDGDGITDYAELLSGSRPRDADSPSLFTHFDIDGDGIDDFLELEAGSDPLDPDSPTLAGNLDVNDVTGPPRDPISDALEAYMIAGGASAPVTTYSDTDGDGVPDFVELRWVSDPLSADSPVPAGNLDVDDSTGPAGDGLTDAAEFVLAALGVPTPVLTTSNSDNDVIPDAVELITGSNPVSARSPLPNRNADIDLDGAADYLEIAMGTDPASADDPLPGGGADGDGDGLTDALEFLLEAGGSMLPVQPVTDTDGDGLYDYLEVRMASRPYDGDHPVVNGGLDVEDRNGPPDDGISDAFEFYLVESGSPRPALRRNDADGDEVPDYLEAQLAYDPFDADEPLLDGGLDSDGDGVSNAFELVLAQLGSNTPVDGRTDTDTDGAPDHLEVFAGTNPYSANEPIVGGYRDADGDGIADALEKVLVILGAQDPITPRSDNDFDGIPDGFEVASGTHPLNGNHPLVDGGADVVDATGPADTMSDGLEALLIELGAVAPVSRRTDTDNDGAPDHLEAFASASPVDRNDPVPQGSLDLDHDGLSEGLEEVLRRWGAIPPVGRASDTDGDGAPDFLEVAVGEHPVDPNVPVPFGATTGFDSNSVTGPANDGISDALERILIDLGCAAPISSFSDHDVDGLPDYFEARFGTDPVDGDDPLVAGGNDSDDMTGPSGDGMSDGLEAFLIAGGATGPVDLTTDTDGDGVPDYYEVFKGSDPFDPTDSIPSGTKPSAINLQITGTLFSGRTVRGEYLYLDAQGDPEGASTYRWKRDNNVIPGENGPTYVIRDVDLGSQLTFEVTPVSLYAFPPTTEVGDPTTVVTAVPVPQYPQGAGGPGGIPLNDLVAWYRSDQGLTLVSGVKVDEWEDIIAGVVAERGAPARRPDLIPASGPNDRPAIRGETAALKIVLNDLPEPLFLADFTLVSSILTTDPASNSNAQGLISGLLANCPQGESDFHFGIKDGLVNFRVGGGQASGTTLLNDGIPHRVMATRIQTSGRIQVFADGVLEDSTLGGRGPLCSNLFWLLSSALNGTYYVGDMFETMMFRRRLNVAELTLLDTYLCGEYGGELPVPRYTHFDTHPDQITGIGRAEFGVLVGEAEGTGIVRIGDAQALDDGDYLFWGTNDAEDFSLSTNVPAPFPNRLNRHYAFTISGEPESDGVGAVTIRFRVSGLFLRPQSSAFALLLDNDEDFSDATVITANRTYDVVLGTIRFEGVDISDYTRFTLAVTPQ